MLKRTRRSSERVHAVKKRKSRKKLNEEKIENITLLAGLIDKYDINYRKRKLTTYQAVETMMYMNKSAISYDEATSIVLRNIVDSSTLRKRIQAWMNMDIPKLVWEEITREYMEQRFKENKKFFKNVFIDATMIKNDLGVDCLGPNPTDRGRPGTKLSALTTYDKVIIGYSFAGANKPDVKEVENVLKSVPISLRKDQRMSTNLIADKGYVDNLQKKDLWRDSNIRKVTENKKTPKIPIPLPLCRKDEALLRKRYVVENVFCTLKKSHRRFQIRRDRYIRNFSGLFLFAATTMTLNVMRDVLGENCFERIQRLG